MANSEADQNPKYWLEYSNLQKVKHDLIRDYLGGWFPKLALGPWGSRKLLYLDTHAGRGTHMKGQLGSPLVALEALMAHTSRDAILNKAEIRFCFIERDGENLRRLKEELKAREPLPRKVIVDPIVGDCFKVLEEAMRSLEVGGTQLAPSFIFCDPYGFSIPGATLKKLMRYDRVELFVNVIWRELDMALKQGDREGMANRLCSVFDGSAWKYEITSSNYNERAEQCVKLFRKMTGARWATYVRMLGDNMLTRYFLLHLTNHDAGRDLMKDCVWRVCPEGGYLVRKSDDPAQEVLIKPEPDLAPLRAWVIDKLSERPRNWKTLIDAIRPEVWRQPHLNQVVRELHKEGKIIGEGYSGHFTAKQNPLLRVK